MEEDFQEFQEFQKLQESQEHLKFLTPDKNHSLTFSNLEKLLNAPKKYDDIDDTSTEADNTSTEANTEEKLFVVDEDM
ncbi:hypothetical protein [Candidatus Bandiella numerosa]|uniref:hypothetical protein n=1 Tax=Candidatus Bandiella numerosa TaxID=2570586 RepID=UPI001F2D044C|nr:hypothetical protein [Candidatus Bandiella numerosa]